MRYVEGAGAADTAPPTAATADTSPLVERTQGAQNLQKGRSLTPSSPILVVPYMWIGNFVRCHTVVKLLRARDPSHSIDMLTTGMVAPLLDYVPGVRTGIVI